MVAIRNRTNIPHVFRYPKYEYGIFYPAGSLCSWPVAARTDSDQAYYDFYVAKYDVPANKNIEPPNDTITWKLIMSTSMASGDSELENRLISLENQILNLELEHDSDNLVLTWDHDSDMDMAYHDFHSADSDLINRWIRDSELYIKAINFADNGTTSRLSWNTDDQTLDLTLNNNVTMQMGQEQFFYGKASEAIAEGEAVMFAGAQGDHLLFKKADASDPHLWMDAYLIGVATENLANNQFGYVTTFGKVRGLDTSMFAEGTLLYLDPTQPGRLVDSEALEPDHAMLIAAVTRSHGTQGTIFVRPKFGEHLDTLYDVSVPAPAHDEFLTFDSDMQVWVAKNINDIMPTAYDFGVTF